MLRLLRIPFDFCAVLVGFLLAYYWRTVPDWIPIVQLPDPNLMPWWDFVSISLQSSLLVTVLMAWEGMYRFQERQRLLREFRKLMTINAAAFMIIIVYFFVVGITFFSRFIFGVAFILTLFLMMAHRVLLRAIQRRLWRKGIGRRRVLFVGDGSRVLEELAQLWKQDAAFEVVGRLAEQKRSVSMGFTKILGGYEEISDVVQKYNIDEIVQVGDVKHSAQIVEYCQLNHVEYRFVPNMLEVQRTNTEMEFVRDIPLITLRSSAIDGWGRVVKRAVDIVGATLGLVLLSPVYLLIAVLIKLSDGGPVFYKSRRVSRNNQFWMWKFRTMVVNADQMKQKLEEMNRRDGPLFKIGNDPRVTRVGKWLRKTTLDELPQFWNVLRGDLSLVGPRAHLPSEIAQYEKHHRRVLAVKAGVTGLPQVSGRSRLDFEQEVKLDVYYIENWSLWLDFKIILQTFGVLFEGE